MERMGFVTNTWSLGGNVIQGITAPQYLQYLRKNLDVLSPSNWRCLHRVLFVGLFSVFNSLLACIERVFLSLHRVDLRSIELPDDIVVIVGHPRSGTTHLHNLMCTDVRFACVRTIDVGFPNSNILLQRCIPSKALQILERYMLPKTRPMDALPLTWMSPQEDEIATNIISAGRSPYASLSFMPKFRHYLKYLTFQDVSKEDFLCWSESFRSFLRRIVYLRLSDGRRRLVLKSPAHTARVDLIRRMFPRCSFVFIHRDPIDVIKSSLHMAQAYFPKCYLQSGEPDQVINYTLLQHEEIYKAILSSTVFKEKSRFVEIRYEDLVQDTFCVLRKVYEKLDLGTVPRANIQAYLDDLSLRKFVKNDHQPLDCHLEERIRRETSWISEKLGYIQTSKNSSIC
jgi:hypothetical protein